MAYPPVLNHVSGVQNWSVAEASEYRKNYGGHYNEETSLETWEEIIMGDRQWIERKSGRRDASCRCMLPKRSEIGYKWIFPFGLIFVNLWFGLNCWSRLHVIDFKLYALLDIQPPKRFDCVSDVLMFGSVNYGVSKCILNLLKIFYLTVGKCRVSQLQ